MPLTVKTCSMTLPVPSAPSGAYAKYKRATAHFLDWLLCVRHSSNADDAALPVGRTRQPNPNATRSPLDEYERIVAQIVRAPAAHLSPSLRQRWPRARAACEAAITLRERVALYFAPSPSHTQHAHFVARLRAWRDSLQAAWEVVVADGGQELQSDTGVRAVDCTNYYAVLDLPDEYFRVDEASTGPVSTTANAQVRPRKLNAERKLVETVFALDLELELAYFLLELEELSEAVYSAFFDVKLQKKTLVEAAVVAKVAIDCAASVIARYQLRCPTVRDAYDLFDQLVSHLEHGDSDSWHDQINHAWAPPVDTKPTYQYVAGTIVHDVLWVTKSLRTFVPGLDNSSNTPVRVSPYELSTPYDEELTPDYVVPNLHWQPTFWLQQIPALLNMHLRKRGNDRGLKDGPLTSLFFAPLDKFFTTSRVPIEAIFVCSCWIRSVAALQGNGDLGRNISLSIQHRWDLVDRIRQSAARPSSARSDLEKLMKTMEVAASKSHVVRQNPLLAGLYLIEHQFEFLQIGAAALFSTSRYRAVGHAYSALRHYNLVEPDPLWEDLLRLFDRDVFPQSAVSDGSFLQVYLRNSRDLVQDFALQLVESVEPVDRVVRRGRVNRSESMGASRVVRLIQTNDFSVLPMDVVGSSSWNKLLVGVSKLCSEELFTSRVLSRDLLQLDRALESVFDTMKAIPSIHSDIKKLLAGRSRRKGLHAENCATEAAVAVRVLSLLDRATSETAGHAKNGPMAAAHDDNDVMPLMIDSLSRAFCNQDPVQQERSYFTFLRMPNWITVVFGESPFLSRRFGQTQSATPDSAANDAFARLFDIMTSVEGSLSDSQLQDIKRLIIAHPSVIRLHAEDRDARLCTILHQAAAGRARSYRLVEWLVHMGALHHQPFHHNREPRGELAVHSAARAGLVTHVRLLLEGGNFRDLDTVTAETKESLAHVAVRNSDFALFTTLHRAGASLTGKDAAGKCIFELTDDKFWRKQLLKSVLAGQKVETQWYESRPRQLPIRKHVVKDAEGKKDHLADTPTSLAIGATVDSNSVIGRDGNTSLPSSGGRLPLVNEDRVGQLSSALDRLKQTRQLPQEERDANVLLALTTLDLIQGSVGHFLRLNTDFTTAKAAIVREATDASYALISLTKFHRQLPQPLNIPRYVKWGEDERGEPDLFTNWARLTHRAGFAHGLLSFISFTTGTAELFVRCGRLAQAREVLELAERRLLKCKYRSSSFRTCVELVASVGKRAGRSPPIGTTPDAQRQLEWYAASQKGNGWVVLDRLYGYDFYCVLQSEREISSVAREKLQLAMNSLPPNVEVVMVGNSVVLAAEFSEELSHSIMHLVRAAKAFASMSAPRRPRPCDLGASSSRRRRLSARLVARLTRDS